MSRYSRKTAIWIPVLLVFPAMGLFVGWLLGASNSPVVATALPLLFGLFGAVSYALIERAKRSQEFDKKLDDLKLDEPIRERVRTAFELDRSWLWAAAFWSTGVILFCLSCYVGVLHGINVRSEEYKSTEAILAKVQINPNELTPYEWTLIYKLRFNLQQLNVPQEEITDVFSNIVRKRLNQPKEQLISEAKALGGVQSDQDARGRVLAADVTDLLKTLNTISDVKPIVTGGRQGVSGR